MATEPRDYTWYDVLDTTDDARVAHLSGAHTLDTWGAWYTLCGRIVHAWRVPTLEDTAAARICGACHTHVTNAVTATATAVASGRTRPAVREPAARRTRLTPVTRNTPNREGATA